MTFDRQGNAFSPCGVCATPTMLSGLAPHRIVTGRGFTKVDARPTTLTGGRLGAEPQLVNRAYDRVANVAACARCRGVQLLGTPRLVRKPGK